MRPRSIGRAQSKKPYCTGETQRRDNPIFIELATLRVTLCWYRFVC